MKFIFNFFVIVICIFFISACDEFELMGNKGKFYYSNPTINNVNFKVDENEYEVLPNENGFIRLSTGLHTMTDNKGNITRFMVFEHNSGGIINPYQFTYYTLSEVYTLEEKKLSLLQPSVHSSFYGHELFTPLKSTHAQVIDGNLFRCHYSVGEKLPSLITSQDDNLDENVISKCFDKNELIKYINAKASENKITELMIDKSVSLTNVDFTYEIPNVDFSDQNIQSIAHQLITLIIQLRDSDNTDIHNKLNTQFHQLSIEFVDAHIASTIEHGAIEKANYAKFFKQINQLQNSGVWIK